MFSILKPSSEAIRRFLSDQSNQNYTYSAVGGTSGTPPAGFVVDHTRIQLGKGQPVFEAAKMAIKRWEHFQLGWVETSSKDIPIERGQIVGVMARAFGVWVLNACRIVSVIDEAGDWSRFGFVYGTLPGHVASGEERFQVEWNRSDDTVWYDILAFSRPNHVLTRLGYPIVRRIQKQFARDSAAAMQLAVKRLKGGTAKWLQPRHQQSQRGIIVDQSRRTPVCKAEVVSNMKRPLPRTPAAWLKEIKLAIADAAEAEPFGRAIGEPITLANLFHLAPHVCLKFRGQKPTGKEADRVIRTSLTNYVANSDPEGIDHNLKQRPLMAFVLCYVAAHLALDLLDEQQAEKILIYCEEKLEE